MANNADKKLIKTLDFQLEPDRLSKKGDSMFLKEKSWKDPTKGSWHHVTAVQELCIEGKLPSDIDTIDVTYTVNWNEQHD